MNGKGFLPTSLALASLTIVCGPVQSHGSSLAIINTGDSIVLAADSKQTNLITQGTNSNSCKISPLRNGVVFASVGVRSATDTASGETRFEAHETATEVCMRLTDVDDCVRAFDNRVRLDYAGVILAGAFHSRVGPEPQALFTSVFAGFTEGSPRVVRIEWSAVLRTAPLLRGKGTLRGRTERLMPGKLWVVGSVKASGSRVNQVPEDFETYGDVEYTRQLIEAEIEANPG